MGERQSGRDPRHGGRRPGAAATGVESRHLGRHRRPRNRNVQRGAESGRGGGTRAGRAPGPGRPAGAGGPPPRMCPSAGARRRLALRSRCRGGREGGRSAHPDLPPDRCASGDGCRHRRSLRRGDPVRALLPRPPRCRRGLTLAAIPARGSCFLHWRGACRSSRPSCVLRIPGPATAVAVFAKTRP